MGMTGFDSKTRYALLAAMDLAAHYRRDTPIKVEDIAGRTGAPVKYLGQIPLRLKMRALVGSVQGPGGGYWLMRRPELISVAEVLGAVATTRRTRTTFPESPYGAALDRLAQEMRETERRLLSSISLADLAARSSG